MSESITMLHGAAEAEIAAFEDFRSKFTFQVPPPVQASVRLTEQIGWQFILILIQALAAITLAAMRTAHMFYEIAATKSLAMAYAEAAAAVLAIEGGIVVFAAIRAEAQNRTSGDALKVSVSRLLIGEGLGLLISIVAGLGLSFTGLGLDAGGFRWALALIIGIGASVVAAVSGDVLGAMLARLGNIRDQVAHEFKNEHRAWQEGMYAAWQRSDERKITRGELVAAARGTRSFVRSPNRSTERTNNDVAGKIVAYLNEHSTPDFVPGPTAISEALGTSKSHASVVRTEWMAENRPHFPAQEIDASL